MKTNTAEEKVVGKTRVTTKISIRRKKNLFVVKGDDATFHKMKIGSSFAKNSKSHLTGLNFEEEEILLPSIVGRDPKDVGWRNVVKNYWSSISVVVPADGIGTDELYGKVLEWVIEFKDKSTAKRYEEASLELKAKISSEAILNNTATVLLGIDDYVLFRYCLVYGRVANSFKDANKSNRIWFYLYSKKDELKTQHKAFELRTEATKLFFELLEDEAKLDGILRMFKISPTGMELMKKHTVIENKIKENPSDFIDYAKDTNLMVKSFIAKAVEKGLIHNPSNTESYYFGENKEILLGNTLEDAVLYCKSTDEKKKGIVETIKAQLKHNI